MGMGIVEGGTHVMKCLLGPLMADLMAWASRSSCGHRAESGTKTALEEQQTIDQGQLVSAVPVANYV